MSKDTESQHSEASPQPTPGPWEWKMPPWGDRKWLVPASKDLEALPVDPDYRPILDSDPSGGEYFPAIDPESPDGRLIAAAPDLLAFVEHQQGCDRFARGRVCSTCDDLRQAAIAKARP